MLKPASSRVSLFFRTLLPLFVLVLAFVAIGLGINLDGSYSPAGQKEETAQAYSTGGVNVYDAGDLDAVLRGKMFDGTGFEDGAGSGSYSNSSWGQYYNASSGGGNASGWTSKTGQMNSRYQSGSSGNKVVNVYVPKNAYGKYQYNAGTLGFGPCNRITMKIRNNYSSASETISYYVGTIDTSGNYNAVRGSSSSYSTIGYSSSTNMTSITIDFDNHRQNLKSIFIVVKGTSKDNYLYLDDIKPGWVYKSDVSFTLQESFTTNTLAASQSDFSGTMYGNGKTLTVKCSGAMNDNKTEGIFWGTITGGTVRDFTFKLNNNIGVSNYSSNSDIEYNQGLLAGRMDGGNIYGVTIKLNSKYYTVFGEDQADSNGKGCGVRLGAFVGQTTGTVNIYNCTLYADGVLWAYGEDDGGNDSAGTATRVCCGGFVGEVVSGTTNIKSCELGGTNAVIAATAMHNDGDHKSNRCGGVVGQVQSGTLNIDTFDFFYSGQFVSMRAGAYQNARAILGANFGTCNFSNIAMHGNKTFTCIQIKNSVASPLTSTVGSSNIESTWVNHTIQNRLTNNEMCAYGSITVSNSFCYMGGQVYDSYAGNWGDTSDKGEFVFEI